MQKIKSIILAGGSGSRLWPLSRDLYPKQLLALDNENSLLQQTFLRLNQFCDGENILTITNIKHFSDVKLQLNQINNKNIVLGEPLGRNTAPAIASAIEYFKQTGDIDDIVLIVPSDHLIKNIQAFKETVFKGIELANAGYLVTFGIKPTYPETGYGYVKTSENFLTGYKVEKFVEKPNFEKAQKYLKVGNYFWNSGIFMGKISTFLEEIKKHANDIFQNISELNFKENLKINYSVYEKMPSISIDYAVMEKSDKIALVELLSDWNDLGSWQSIYETGSKDECGNVLQGRVVVDNVKNSLIYSQKEIVAASGLEDIILVETEDAIMACKMSESQNVKKLYEKLKVQESDTTKLHKTVLRPWGYYTCLNSGEGYLVKLICVNPKQKLSLQSHNHRSEHWTVLEGEATVILENKTIIVNSGGSIDIPLQAKHSLQNQGESELKIIEVQKGNYISEDDIIRYQDSYGRI